MKGAKIIEGGERGALSWVEGMVVVVLCVSIPLCLTKIYQETQLPKISISVLGSDKIQLGRVRGGDLGGWFGG
ncbi:unnamed protein product [Prunus armeniaca]|uniref:Uncharacterized protein n=1 Tax=Prunus armeniaca TaxID=36596 RepID=A0A6J5X671_PRUAR|nr:unnamed protein product [Prunus armeniaca]CAB4309350.1 unnamed protein product [Prunus armeniaca]